MAGTMRAWGEDRPYLSADGMLRSIGNGRPHLKPNGRGGWVCWQSFCPPGYGMTWQEALANMQDKTAVMQLMRHRQSQEFSRRLTEICSLPVFYKKSMPPPPDASGATLWQRMLSWFGERE